MNTLAAATAALALVVATVTLHYEALRYAADVAPRLRIPPRRRILAVIAVALVAHVGQILLYALAFAAMDRIPGLGGIAGALEGDALDYFYYSAANFTTLGVGDVVPFGAIRLVVAIESLNGLVLIGWSASFTYIEMQKFWQDHR